jgi:hypothetical protein
MRFYRNSYLTKDEWDMKADQIKNKTFDDFIKNPFDLALYITATGNIPSEVFQHRDNVLLSKYVIEPLCHLFYRNQWYVKLTDQIRTLEIDKLTCRDMIYDRKQDGIDYYLNSILKYCSLDYQFVFSSHSNAATLKAMAINHLGGILHFKPECPETKRTRDLIEQCCPSTKIMNIEREKVKAAIKSLIQYNRTGKFDLDQIDIRNNDIGVIFLFPFINFNDEKFVNLITPWIINLNPLLRITLVMLALSFFDATKLANIISKLNEKEQTAVCYKLFVHQYDEQIIKQLVSGKIRTLIWKQMIGDVV